MSNKGINIKDRNYVIFSGTRSAGKTEEQYFEALMHIIPHKNQFYLSSKEIYDYVTKLLKIKKRLEEDIIGTQISEYGDTKEEAIEYLERINNE